MKQRKRQFVAEIVKLVLTAFFVLLFFSEVWGYRNWDSMTWEELVFQMHTLEGTGGGMVERYFREAFAPAAAVFSLILVVFFTIKIRKKDHRRFSGMAVLVSLILCGFMTIFFGHSLGLFRYYKGSASKELTGVLGEKEFIEYYYVNPAEVEISFPEKKRNLIYIFMESMEMTYGDPSVGGDFDENVIPELTELGLSGDDFSEPGRLNGAVVYNGTNWTMAGMFAQSTGLPLKVPTDLVNHLDLVEEFFPSVTALGDILEKEGYHNELLVGSYGDFGGRENYYRHHGDYEIYDLRTAYENGDVPKDYYVWWGIEDKKLFRTARRQILRLADEEKPFALTLLTADTHFEDGYLCEDCEDDFKENDYADVMRCSGKRVSNFVKWIMTQDFYENTTIVICGDHLTMDTDFCDDVDADYQRRTYMTILNSAAGEKDRYREYSTLDMYPTTLAAMGADIEGEKLGLGVNLYSREATLTEKYGYENVEKLLSEKSPFMGKLSGLGE